MNQVALPKLPTMKELILWVTTDCNLRCRYCYADGGNNPQYMDWKVAKRAMDTMLGQTDSFTVQFAGGEPLLNLPLMEQVISYGRERNICYQVQTNATFIDKKTALKLREINLAVGVSLDGLPVVNDYLRPFPNGRGSTDATLAGIANLRAADIRVGLTCVISEVNIEGLAKLVELASYLGNIDGLSLDLLRPVGKAVGSAIRRVDPAAAARAVSLALQRAEELIEAGGGIVKFREAERMKLILGNGKNRHYHCYTEAGQSLVVKPNGDAYPCPSLTGFPEFYLGNVMEKGFAGKIGAALEQSRQLLSHPAKCLTCNDKWLCGGPCPAQTYAQRQARETSPTECPIKKVFINYAKRKENPYHATKSPTCLSV